MNTTTWIEIDPVDTLFFRGAESMEAGENHEVDTMFPPLPSTIIGALRTAILRQNAVPPTTYTTTPDAVMARLPALGLPDNPGFSLLGPLFKAGETVLLPAPAHWFAELPAAHAMQWDTTHTVQAARTLAASPLGLGGSTPAPFWVHHPEGKDMKSLSGYWVTPKAFAAMGSGSGRITFCNDPAALDTDLAAACPQSTLYVREERMGLALTRQRTAREGHLYSTAHVRLRVGITLVAGICSEHPLPLAAEGILQLGGEQRNCRYRHMKGFNPPMQAAPTNLLYALSPLELSALPETLRDAPRASGKLLRVGGWDMAKNFHKPLSAWLPAGTVFSIATPQTAPVHCLNI